jgi:hypothetical protein
MNHAIESQPHQTYIAGRSFAIEVEVAKVCRGTPLLRSAISILVGVTLPWATRKDIFDAIDRMVGAGWLVQVNFDAWGAKTFPMFVTKTSGKTNG